MTVAVRGEEIVDAVIALDAEDAEEFDTRFQSALGAYAEAREELIACVETVRSTDVAQKMGFKSRGDYVADRVSGLNVKWAVDDRRSLVELMAYDPDGGMSTRQIGAALQVDQKTVVNDMRAGEEFSSPGPRKIQGSDGKTYTHEQPTEEERAQRFKEAHERLIDEGVAPGPRTEEEEQEAADRFVNNLVGNTQQPFSPEDKFAKALNAVGAAIRINHHVNEALLNEDGWSVLRSLGLR